MSFSKTLVFYCFQNVCKNIAHHRRALSEKHHLMSSYKRESSYERLKWVWQNFKLLLLNIIFVIRGSRRFYVGIIDLSKIIFEKFFLRYSRFLGVAEENRHYPRDHFLDATVGPQILLWTKSLFCDSLWPWGWLRKPFANFHPPVYDFSTKWSYKTDKPNLY